MQSLVEIVIIKGRKPKSLPGLRFLAICSITYNIMCMSRPSLSTDPMKTSYHGEIQGQWKYGIRSVFLTISG